MNDSEYTEREEKFYKVLGAFVVEFEHLCLSIRNTIVLLFEKNGLQKNILVDILLHDTTADPLKRYLQALIFECYKDDLTKNPNEKISIEKFFKKIQEAGQLRNDIVHSAWIIGFDSKQNSDNDIAFPIRNKASKNGLKGIYSEYSSTDLSSYFEDLKVLTLWSMIIKENIDNNRSLVFNLEIREIDKLRFKLKSQE